MKYLVALALIAIGCYAYFVMNQPSGSAKSVTSGVVRYGAETLGSVHANGFVTLEGTTVRKTLFVNGSLSAEKATIGQMHVNGHAGLFGCTVNDVSQVNGFMSANKCTFGKELVLSVQKVSFTECIVGAVTVKKPLWVFGTQVVELSDKTICKGPIIFESGNGKIVISGNSQLIGPVHGAEVEKV